MKALIFTLCLFIFSHTVNGQHTLSFSRTLILVSGTSYTVPANTTWKIENVFFNNTCTDLFYSASYSPTLSITPPGGSATSVYYMAQGYGYTPTSTSTLPFWLPEQTVIVPTGATSMLTAIEFIIQ